MLPPTTITPAPACKTVHDFPLDVLYWTSPNKPGGRMTEREEKIERRQVPRCPTSGPIELTELQAGKPTTARLRDLSLIGCRVEAGNRFSAGARVKVRIARSDSIFEALGVVVDSDPRRGAAILFIETNAEGRAAIGHWMAELKPLS